jgi:hypothetical protein
MSKSFLWRRVGNALDISSPAIQQKIRLWKRISNCCCPAVHSDRYLGPVLCCTVPVYKLLYSTGIFGINQYCLNRSPSSKPTSELGGEPCAGVQYFGSLLSRRTQRPLPSTRTVLYSSCTYISCYVFGLNQYCLNRCPYYKSTRLFFQRTLWQFRGTLLTALIERSFSTMWESMGCLTHGPWTSFRSWLISRSSSSSTCSEVGRISSHAYLVIFMYLFVHYICAFSILAEGYLLVFIDLLMSYTRSLLVWLID